MSILTLPYEGKALLKSYLLLPPVTEWRAASVRTLSGSIKIPSAVDPWAAPLWSEAGAFWRLLCEPRGVEQQTVADYGYPAPPTPSRSWELTVRDLARHLSGEVAWGLQLVERNGCCRVIAFDLDERFEERLQVLGDVIRRRDREIQTRQEARDRRRARRGEQPILGGSTLEAGTLCTSGSQPGHGKVVMFFGTPRTRSAMANFAQGLLTEAMLDPRWGEDAPGKRVDVWPTGGRGMCKPVRIGGRHRRPGSPHERTFSLNGEVLGFADVTPIRNRLCGIHATPEAPIPPKGPSRRLERLRAAGMTKLGPEGFPAVALGLYGACRELVARGGGIEDAQQHAAELKAVSPDLTQPSRSTRDRRDPLSPQQVTRTWRKALADHETDRATLAAAYPRLHIDTPPPVVSECKLRGSRRRLSLADGIEQTITALRAFCVEHNLSDGAFWIPTRELGRLLGLTNTAAVKRLAALEGAGLVTVFDRGRSGTRIPMLIGLSPAGRLSPRQVQRRASLVAYMLADREKLLNATLQRRVKRHLVPNPSSLAGALLDYATAKIDAGASPATTSPPRAVRAATEPNRTRPGQKRATRAPGVRAHPGGGRYDSDVRN